MDSLTLFIFYIKYSNTLYLNRAMLTGGMIESKQSSITLAEDISYDAFMAVLHFIYSDKLPTTNPANNNNNNNNSNNNNENGSVNNNNEEPEVDVNVALEAIPVANLFQMDRLKVLFYFFFNNSY